LISISLGEGKRDKAERVLGNGFALNMTISLAMAALGLAFLDPMLFLLHGGLDDGTCWIRGTGFQRYADRRRLAVVAASVGNSFYADMAHGLKYYTFMSEELPWFVRAVFPLSARREDTFIAGLSMGGYGAL
jgi:putative tributyrin esterase